MKNKVYIVSALMAIMLLVLAITGLNNAKMDSISNVGDNTLSQSTSLDFSKVEGQKSLSEILENSDTKIPENKFYKADDMVSVTVVTGTDSVVESYFQNGKGTLSEYAQSSEGKAIENAMKQEQASVQNAMRNANIIFNNKNAFTTLLNGFSAVVRYGDIKLVKAIKGVVGVSVSQVYSVPATTTAAEKQMMFAQTGLLENNSKYKGEGMVIAILDTGLSYRNPAFQTMPENGAITENYLEQIVPALQINKGNKTFAASEVYVNAKVPYGFDYADNDANVIPHEDFSYRLPFDLTHGTHVAGIAAGDNDVITAAACKAQIACMKVFSSLDGNCYTDSILAALSDSAMLGVDAINMSLGNGCGPVKEHDPASAIINNCYELIEKLGINMCIASGNDTYSTNCTYNDNPYSKTEAPDNGVVGSPASYRGTFSVGSIDNGMNIVAKIDGMNISLNNVMREDEHYIQNPQNFLKLLNGDKGEFDYEIVGGSGKEEDFKAVDVKGKIAVVTRQRRISFTEIATNAQANGAIALIICNNEEGQLNALVDTDLPTATTEMQYGEILKASTNKKISLDKDEILYTISEFSSMGALDNLDIGIDIVAPGGNIYSALLYEMYEYWIQQGREALLYNYMSGTSMASPNFASASMVVSQMIKEKYPQLSGDERTALTYQYVMSTAKIITDINGVPVTPRAQGSGIVDINAALSTDAYLTVTGKDRTKLNLGSDVNKDGIYTLSFNLVNTSDKALSYDVKAIAITEVAENGYMMNKARLFENATFTVDAKNASIDGNVVTVEGGQKANIKVVVTLSTEDKQYMDDNFANGIYVEGYAVLTSNSDGVDLSIPWIAFYGDWDKVPTLEPTDMDHKEPINESMILVGKVILIQDVMAMAHRLGMYPTFTLPEGYEAPEASYDYISLRSDSELLYLDLNLMRNVPLIEVSVIDSLTGTIYSFDKLYDIRKDYYYNGFIHFESRILFSQMFPINENLRWANNQSVNLQLKVYRSIEDDIYETINFPIFIDNDAPIMTDVKERVENGRTYLDMQVYDNHYLRDMQLWNLSENLVFSLMYPVTNFVKNSINYVSLDITDFLGNLVDNKIAIDFSDYAFNYNTYEITLKSLEEKVNPTAIKNKNNNMNNLHNNNSFETLNVEDYVIENGILKSYNGIGGDIVIPDGVVSIADNVFNGNKTITSVVMPEGLTEIGNSAFAFAANMTKVVLPSTLITIKESAFMNCLALSDVNFEKIVNIQLIGMHSFMRCGFTELTIPKHFENMANGLGSYDDLYQTFYPAFYLLSSLTKLTINGDVKLNSSFILCEKLKEVVINGNVVFYNGEFMKCDSLEYITFNSDITSVGNSENRLVYSIADLPSLKKVVFNGNVGSLNSGVFSSCPNLTEIVFNKSLDSIDCTVGGDSPKMVYSIGKNNEFMIMENEIIYDNAKTKMFMQPYGDYEGTFVVPETINVLQQGQFSHGVYKLKSNITIYEYSKISISLFTTSSYYTYEKKISGIKLHAGITKIPDACFYDCVALQEIDYNGAEIVEFGALSLSNSIRNITFPDSVKIIKDVTGNCPNLESFVFPKNLEQMVYIDFSNSKIKEIIIPALAGAIPSDYLNFQNCLQLEKVVFLYDRVERILSEFNGCINLKVIEGIDHLTNLFGNGCFYNCGLEKLVISKKMEGIWNYDAFAGLYNLREIYIEKGANPMWKVPKHYGMEIMQPDFAFLLQWNKRLERIVVEDGHEIYASDDGVLYKKASKVISELAYYPLGKTDTHFDVYESIEMINANCFINNQYLKTVSMPNVKYLLQSVFEGSVIESINAPKLEYIGNSTFKNCQNLKSFDFSTVKYISENAFANSALESINIVGDAEIRVFAFADCIQLTSVTIGENVPAFAFDLVFFNGAKIKSININNNPNFIYENDVLYNCNKTILYKSLQSDKTINVVEGVIKIGAAAFINNLTLENVVLPTTLKAIGDKAFYGDINLKSVRINSEVAPMLESVYMENEKLQYSNFVGVIGTEMNLTLFHTANISYETPIWKTYFKNHFTVNADGSIEADSINDNSEKTTVDNKQLSKVSNVVAIAANNNFLTVGTLLLILSSFFATVCKIKFN